MFLYYFDPLYLILGIIVVPGLIIGIAAELKFKTTCSKYNHVFANRNITGHQMAEEVLKAYGIDNVKVVKLENSEPYSDFYSSKDKVLALSEGVYNSSSITALGVAAHELGHALQDKENYFPLKLRTFFGVLSRIGSSMLLPLIILGFIFSFFPTGTSNLATIFFIVGFSLFGCSVLFSLITLPIEINASKRTEKILVTTGLLNSEEFEGVKKVLTAAALTYVAGLINSLLNFARVLLYFLIIRKKR